VCQYPVAPPLLVSPLVNFRMGPHLMHLPPLPISPILRLKKGWGGEEREGGRGSREGGGWQGSRTGEGWQRRGTAFQNEFAYAHVYAQSASKKLLIIRAQVTKQTNPHKKKSLSLNTVSLCIALLGY